MSEWLNEWDWIGMELFVTQSSADALDRCMVISETGGSGLDQLFRDHTGRRDFE